MSYYKERNVHRKAVRAGIIELKPLSAKSLTKHKNDWLVVCLDYPLAYWLKSSLQIERVRAKPARFKVLNECRTEEAASKSRRSHYECEWVYGRTFVVHRAIFEAHYKGKEIG